jgi:tetratricopeptide (TPR) repeat protein
VDTKAADPRWRIVAGVAVFFVLGLGVRTVLGPTPSAGFHMNQAIRLAGDGDWQGAYDVLQKVVVSHPQDPDAWMRAGKALSAIGRPYDAAVYLSKAAELDSTSSIVQIEHVNGLIRAELYDEAQAAVDAALARNPTDAGMLYLASSLAARRGDAETAARLFREAAQRGAYRPDRFRSDPLFDPVRNAPEFLQAVYDTRTPGAFAAEGKS